MTAAGVRFVRDARKVRITLMVDGTCVAESTSTSFIAREIAARGITTLSLTDTYAISIPACSDTLAEAAKRRLGEPLAAFILISECTG